MLTYGQIMHDQPAIRLKILLVSRRKEALDALDSALKNLPGVQIERKLVVNGHVDPLHDVAQLPDALILHLGETWQAELQSLAARPADRRPPLIVVGSASDSGAMRLAMQAGARDLLPLPLVRSDLIAALERIDRDHRAAASSQQGTLTAFINAKGGCGATLLSCNVAHALATTSGKRVALLDLDLQFGAIPLYFDLFPKRGVLQALENVEGLDDMALSGYMAKHVSGLEILGHASEDQLPLAVASVEALRTILNVSMHGRDHIIVDLPRRIDPAALMVLERAQHIAVIVQQSVTVLRDANRLLNCLRRDLGVSPERIVVVVNRFEKDAAISPVDIRNTLNCGELSLVPNDYRTVSEGVDAGQPLLAFARNAAITKAVNALVTRLGGGVSTQPSLIARAFSSLIKPRAT